MVSCPLLTPFNFLRDATPFGCASKRGLRGLGSGRQGAYGTLLDPEVTLRDLPRITVHGQPVQGENTLLRKALLRSRMEPWSTKRICGPLAFRREAMLSVQRKVWGVKRGKKTIGCLSLLAPVGGHRHPRPPKAANVRALRRRKVASSGEPLYRRNRLPSAEGKEERGSRHSGGKRLFSLYLTKIPPRKRLFSLKFRLHY